MYKERGARGGGGGAKGEMGHVANPKRFQAETLEKSKDTTSSSAPAPPDVAKSSGGSLFASLSFDILCYAFRR